MGLFPQQTASHYQRVCHWCWIPGYKAPDELEMFTEAPHSWPFEMTWAPGLGVDYIRTHVGIGERWRKNGNFVEFCWTFHHSSSFRVESWLPLRPTPGPCWYVCERQNWVGILYPEILNPRYKVISLIKRGANSSSSSLILLIFLWKNHKKSTKFSGIWAFAPGVAEEVLPHVTLGRARHAGPQTTTGCQGQGSEQNSPRTLAMERGHW